MCLFVKIFYSVSLAAVRDTSEFEYADFYKQMRLSFRVFLEYPVEIYV